MDVNQNPNEQQQNYYQQQNYNQQSYQMTSPILENHNKGMGTLGAFLGALVGGALWMGIGCLGFISGWIAVIIFLLANFGYKKLSGGEDKYGYVISLVFGLIMIIPATYGAYAYSVWKGLNTDIVGHFSFLEVVLDLPMYMERYGLWMQFIGNLALGYVFSLAAGVMGLVGNMKKR